MRYFLETVETIGRGVGFNYYDKTHLLWLMIFMIFTIGSCYFYKKSKDIIRKRIRIFFATSIILDEVFKIIMLLIGGNYSVEYLPLHLCSINIFIIAYHVYKPSKTLDNYLYSVCIPAALCALLFPTWIELPVINFMHLHSFTIHILLAAYPIMLVAGGDICPDRRLIPKSILFTVIFAIPIYIFNLIFDTNFMFLMYAEPGNPLYWFGENLGNHLLGIPVIYGVVLILMYFPFYIKERKFKKSKENQISEAV